MSLRIQLLGLGLLTLALPWAGYRYVQELEGALRAGLEQSLLASAGTMAAALSEEELGTASATSSTAPEHMIYAHPLGAAPALDGFRDDWSTAAATGLALGARGRYWVGLHDRALFLFLSLPDDAVVYQRAPGQTPYGDRVLLLTETEALRWFLFHTSAPGALRAQRTDPPLFAPTGRFDSRIIGFWRETGDGVALEIRLPVDLAGRRLGVSTVDVDPASGTGFRVTVDSSWREGEEPNLLLYRPANLGSVARQFVQPGRRLRVVGSDGWVLFDGGAIDPLSASFDDTPPGVAEQFYRFILRRDDPPFGNLESPPGRLADPTLRDSLAGRSVTAWYARGVEESAVVAAAVPISRGNRVLGAVIVEEGSDSILTLTNEALVRLMSFTLVASVLVAMGLLSYATFLSFRVRRLARAAENALGPRGEIRTALPGSRAKDEIGDLARSFADLLGRLREYTDYLSTLKGKLAHELRTPLAVVSTSLDNLEREPHASALSPYLVRLREGAARLDGILNAMSEATVIEQAITSTDPVVFDLGRVLASCTDAYRDVYPERRFSYENAAPRTSIRGSAELIAQMMDKLVDNAVSFSPVDSTIEIRLMGNEQTVSVTIANRGPTLPTSMRSQLFDSLVSVREEDNARRHLGLGLYIVSLIAEYHAGSVRGEDLADGSGVIFTIDIPVTQQS